MDSTVVTLDLRGTKFKTLRSTFNNLDLAKFPPFKVGENEYFIDRDPKDFHSVLDTAGSVDSNNQMDDFVVTLDVRGTKFKTLNSTLKKLSLDKVVHLQISDTEYFIDRDPKFFHVILNLASGEESLYLTNQRNTICWGIPEDEHETFIKETQVYGLCHCNVNDNYGTYTDKYSKFCKKHEKEFKNQPRNEYENNGYF